MEKGGTKLQRFIGEELGKLTEDALPARAGFLERALVRRVRVKKLHPNPFDEFCFPDIGPNESIVARYTQAFLNSKSRGGDAELARSAAKERLEVQKLRMGGYMILNGHHRWAAAAMAGIPRLKVHILNLTQEKDLLKMLKKARHDQRVVLDLDEVVFVTDPDAPAEKPLPYPFSKFYPQRLRPGIPDLFSSLIGRGYDIWLYSGGYISVDHVRELLMLRRIPVTGVITGTNRKGPKGNKTREAMEKLLAGRYAVTLHADSQSVTRVDSRTRDFREYALDPSAVWHEEILKAVGALEKPPAAL